MAGAISLCFEASQLAFASYAPLEGGMSRTAFIDSLTNVAGMAEKQATELEESFEIVDQKPNTAEGLSATLFKRKLDDHYFLAIRGSEHIASFQGLIDWGHADFGQLGKNGVTLGQAIDLFNYFQELNARQGEIVYRYGFDQATLTFGYSSSVAPGDGALVGKNFTLTGHSLGGHLAIALSRLAPDRVTAVYTYNSPGFDPTVLGTPIPGVERFFAELRRAQTSASGSSNIGMFFDVGKFTNLMYPPDLVHNVGVMPGGQIAQFNEGGGPINDHRILGMTDALAVYALLSQLDPRKSANELLTAGANVLRAAANTAGASLEGLVNALGDLLRIGATVGVGNREQLYQRLNQIRDEITDPNTGELKLGYQGIQFLDATMLGTAALADAGAATGDDGLAYRYALDRLNPFVLLGPVSLYAPHNMRGELDRYDVTTDSGITDRWLEDRAEFLAALMAYNNEDRNDQVVPGSTTYWDVNRRLSLRPFAPTRAMAFAQVGEALSGQGLASEGTLYGTVVGETIRGSVGDSKVEANGGNDTVTTYFGNDEIYGGAGNDAVEAGEGNDVIVGGKGDDKSLRGGDGDDHIWGDEAQQGKSASRYSDANYSGDDELHGEGGNDFLYGGAGADRLEGGSGTDRLFGDGADPEDSSRLGDDILIGGDGTDYLYGGDGTDEIYGDDETVDGSTVGEADFIRGGKGDDLIYAGGGHDVDVDGEEGEDLIVGGHGNDVLRGGEDADEIYGGLYEIDDVRDQGADLVYGGTGDDELYGGNGRDILYGEENNDTLRGGAGNDRLEGGTGFDRYIYEAKDGRDIILDQDGSGQIEWADTVLVGGRSRNKDDLIWYDDPDNPRFTYAASGDPNEGPVTLTVTSREGGLIEIQEFRNRDLRIELTPGSPDEPPFPSPGPSGPTPLPPPPDVGGAPIPWRGDPLVLDLDGLGFGTLGFGAGLHFDHDSDGFAELTGWVGAGDGVLVLDLDEDGRLSNGQELFGDFTRLAGGQLAVNGFAALSAHDRDGDGAITALDPIWSSLRVGSFDSEEGRLLLADPSTGLTLVSLDELGITSLGLGSAIVNETDAQGNTRARTGAFSLADGTTQELAEFRFARDPMRAVPVDAPVMSAEIAGLPQLTGGAKVLRFREALELDARPEGYLGKASGSLRANLDAFMAETDVSAFYARFEELLAAWTGVDAIPPGQLRGEIAARHIAVLEKFYGQSLAPNPHHWQTLLWEKNYQDLAEAFYGDLLAQTHFAEDYAAIELVAQGEEAPFGNLMPLIAGFEAAIAADPTAGQALLNEFGRSLRGRRLTQSTNYFAFREHFVTDAAGVLDEDRAFAFDAVGKRVVLFTPETPSNSRRLGDYTEAARALDGQGLIANGGDDVLYGDEAGTGIVGGAYDNVLYGGPGNDTLSPDAGNDVLDGGAGNDYLYGSVGDDTYLFRPGSGHDQLVGEWGGFDVVFFGGGLTRNDLAFEPNFRGAIVARILATGETFALPGGSISLEHVAFSGIERFMFSDGSIYTAAEIFSPSATPDTLLGTQGEDSIDGLAGADRIVGYGGNDLLIGGEGDDLILPGSGDDVVDGGPGNDRIDPSEYLQAPGWWYGWGLSHDDTYRFGYGDGADLINELQGTDTLLFKPGVTAADLSFTNEGHDLVIRLAGSADSITVKNHFMVHASGAAYSIERLQFADGTVLGTEVLANATISGTSDEDRLEGYANANNRILGLEGDDVLSGSDLDDTLEGGEGKDWLIGRIGDDRLLGGDGNDRLEDSGDFHGTESNTLDGGVGDDVLNSGLGDDILLGGEGNDHLRGGHGSDIFIGGAGDDILEEVLQPSSFSLGADVFVFGRGDGHDRVVAADVASGWVSGLVGPRGEVPTHGVRLDDVLRFSDEVSPGDIVVFGEIVEGAYLRQSNVRFEIAGDPDSSVTLEGFMGESAGSRWLTSSVRRIEFADGTVWSVDDVLDRLVWQGTEGNDSISAGMLRDVIYGEGGNDGILSWRGDDRIYAGEGDDFIDSGEGNDIVEAGDGDDTIVIGGPGSDLVDPGTGNDLVGYSFTDVAEGRLFGFAPPVREGDTTVLFGAGYGSDSLFLGNARLDSNDVIRLADGLAPEDVKLVRRDDALILRLPVTGDSLSVIGWFSDHYDPWRGVLIEHPYRVETIQFADGTSWGVERMLTEVLIGTADSDRLLGYASDDLIEGHEGSDELFGGEGNDILDGGAGNDFLQDAGGADTVRFGRGDGIDTYRRSFSDATDTIEIKAGVGVADVQVSRFEDSYQFWIVDTDDYLLVDSPAPLEARFEDGSVWSFEDIKSLTLIGTEFGDLLVGYDDRDDLLQGNGSFDELQGGSGNDTYVYKEGDGTDFIFDAAGELDTLRFGPGITLDSLTFTSAGVDLVLLTGNGGHVSVTRGLAEHFDGSMPNAIERIEFADGTLLSREAILARVDRVILPGSIFGTEFDDWLEGNDLDNAIFGLEGDDELEGSDGNDTLEGNTGDDGLYGDEGDDLLLGGEGNDWLDGGSGRDTLQGGEGTDSYFLGWDGALDTILDEFSSDGGGGIRGDRFPEALERVRYELAAVLELGGEGNYYDESSPWGVEIDGGWASDLPYELVEPLFYFDDGEGVPAAEAEAALRALLEWLEAPASRADLFPEVADAVLTQLGELQEYGDDGWYWNGIWDDLNRDGFLDEIPEYLTDPLVDLSHSEGDGAVVWRTALFALEEWLGGAPEGGDILVIDAYPEEIEVQVTGNQVAIGIWGTDDAVLIRPLEDDGSAGALPQVAVQQFVFWDDIELSLQEIVDLADGGVIGLQEDFAGSSYLRGSVAEDEIYGYEGDDDIDARANDDYVDGGEGDDRVAAGSGEDEVFGGEGDDVIAGGWGDDHLAGGEGDDVYAYNLEEGEDFIDSLSDAGLGTDTLSLGADITPEQVWLYFDGGDLQLVVDWLGSVRTAWFDEDGVENTSRELRRLQFVDYDGAAVVYDLEAIVRANLAAMRADYLWLMDVDLQGARLAEALAGGGAAVAYAQSGDLFGLPYFAGNQPTEGADQQVGSDAAEEIDAGSGDDQVSAGAGDDLVWGGAGDDALAGGAGADELLGGAGDDVLSGGGGDDFLVGGTGDDLARGGAGVDTYAYARGDGRLTIEDAGSNTIEFAADITFDELTLTYASEFLELRLQSEGDLVRVAGFQPDDAHATTGVSSFYFEAEDRTYSLAELFAKGFDFAGSESADELLGTSVVDRVVAGDGGDAIRGGTGDDVLDGGLGSDTYYFEIGDGFDLLIDRESEFDRNSVVFGPGISAATLEAYVFGQSLYLAYGPLGEDQIEMPDTVLGDIERSFAFDQMRFADGTSLTFTELLDQGLSITGTPQADRLVGAGGADSLWGLQGDDLMLGGAGADVYYIDADSGVDTIDDLSRAGEENSLVLSIEGLQPEELTLSYDGEAGTLDLDLGGGNRVKLAGFDPQDPLGDRALEAVEFYDGTSLSYEELLALGITIPGTPQNDVLRGTPLRDYLHAGAGDDYLDAGPGGGIAYGGAGDDAYAYDRGDGELRIVEQASATPGNMVLFGPGIALADFRNNLRFVAPAAGSPGELLIDLGGGDLLRIEGFDPNDAEHGAHGVQSFVFADGSSVDYSELVRSTFIVQGDTGDDALGGTNIADRLYGYEANDELRSGGGMDTLTGGPGDDLLEGGADGDMYVFNRGDGIDLIHEDGDAFDENLVVFGPGITRADLAFALEGGVLRIGYGPGDEVRIEGFDPSAPAIREIRFDDGSVLPIGAALNAAPQAGAALPDLLVQEDAAFALALPSEAFSDAEGEALSLSASRSNGFALPGWLAFDAATGTLSGTAGNIDVGSYSITVTATDTYGLSASQSFVLTVANVNDAPVLAREMADQLVAEDQAFVIELPADLFADVDAGDALSLSASLAAGSPLPSWLAFDPSSGVLSGVPSNADVGFHQLRITATDRFGASTSQEFRLAVSNVNDIPEIARAIEDQSPTEDVPFSFTLAVDTFADADLGDTLAYFASRGDGTALPAWLAFHSDTLTFSGAPTNDDVGLATLRVLAVDQHGAAVGTEFQIVVANTNDAPIVSMPLGGYFAREDEPFGITVPGDAFVDVDLDDSLSYSAASPDGSSLPPWLTFDASTRMLSGTPSNADVGAIDIRITATDAAGEGASSELTIVVDNVNDAPVLTAPLADQVGREGEALAFPLPAGLFADVDAGDSLTLSASLADGSALPAWLAFDSVNGAFSGTPESDDAGAYAIRVTGTDAAGASASDLFDLVIEEAGGRGQVFVGTSGDDLLEGTPFNDMLDGRGGVDRLAAQAGDDVLQFFADGRWTRAGFARHAGSPGLRGTGELVWLGGNYRSHDIFDGGAGFDALLGTDGHDALFLDDRLSPPDDYHGPRIAGIEHIATGAGNDLVDLTSRLYAYGDVMLDGGDGNDTLWASSGSDVLSGGRGNDRLSGGAGSDLYLYAIHGGHDVIEEAGTSGGQDVLRFGEGITQAMVRVRRQGGDLLLDAGRNSSVTIRHWFTSSAQRIEYIQFADGSGWDEGQIRGRVAGPGYHCEPHHGSHHKNDDDERGRKPRHQERTADREDDRRTHNHDRLADFISARLSSLPRFDFQAITDELSRPAGPAPDVEEIARRWQAVAAYASALGVESDGETADAAPLDWRMQGRLGAAGWGFEGSVGAARGFADFQTLEGLLEGFRRL